jgi:GDP-L-fucose synthase
MNLSNECILVTGGTGFLGTHVVAQLKRAGVPDSNILIPRHADYDLTQADAVARIFRDMTPTVVIHLAAEVGGIGANRASPGRFFYANMAMGLHLIEQSRLAGVKKFVQLGTVCAYPKHTPVPFREDDLWTGYPEETNAPYGIAKKALLVMLQSYRAQYNFNGIYLLPVNLYGPGDNFDLESGHVIPALIRKFIEARDANAPAVTLWGTGKASREFLYVEDCARAVVAALTKYDGPEPINLGSGMEITIADLADKIRTLVGYSGRIEWDVSKPDGQPRRCMDISRARKLLAFEPEMDFDEGLRRTIEWYRQNKAAR